MLALDTMRFMRVRAASPYEVCRVGVLVPHCLLSQGQGSR